METGTRIRRYARPYPCAPGRRWNPHERGSGIGQRLREKMHELMGYWLLIMLCLQNKKARLGVPSVCKKIGSPSYVKCWQNSLPDHRASLWTVRYRAGLGVRATGFF
jgi:hypothetical protein